jgi:hypothetical protein
MAVADTAKLIASLELKDNLSAGVKSASGAIGSLETKFGSLGNALGHAKSQIGGLLSGPLGLLGLGGGLYGIEQVISDSLRKTDQLGEAVEKLTGITGMSATSASMMLAVFSRFGIDAERTTTALGFEEKALGNLTKAWKAEDTFTQEFGFALRETTVSVKQLAAAEAVLDNKKATTAQKTAALAVVTKYQTAAVKDAQSVFEDLADYWIDTTIPQSQKAALAAKLLGKGYIDLVPALNEGSKGIKVIEQQARDLGLVMDAQNMGQLKEYHESMEKMGMAVGALQLQIGLGLAPVMTELTGTLTTWLSHGGVKQIADWFRNGAAAAKELAGGVIEIGKAIADDPIFKGLIAAWNAVPDDLKKILIGGFAVEKATSWLFGTSPLELLKDLGGGAAKAVGTTGASKLAPQNVFVVNWAMMGGAGGLGGAAKTLGGEAAAGGAAAAGGIGLGTIALGVGAIVSTVTAAYLAKEFADQTGKQQADTNQQILDWQMKQTTPEQNAQALAAEVAAYRDSTSTPWGSAITNTFAGSQMADALKTAAGKITGGTTIAPESIQALKDAIGVAQSLGNTDLVNQLTDDLATVQRRQSQQDASAPPKPTVLSAGDKDNINHAANLAHADVMAQLRGHWDTKKAIADGAAIAKVYGTGTALDMKWANKNIRELTAVQQAFAARGDTATAAALGADIAVLRDALAGKLDLVVQAVKTQPTSGVAGRTGTTPYAGENQNPGGTNRGPASPVPIILRSTTNVSSKDVQKASDIRTGYRAGVPQ